jgi:hypothetical protein
MGKQLLLGSIPMPNQADVRGSTIRRNRRMGLPETLNRRDSKRLPNPMKSQDLETILLIKGAISELPAAQMEACQELAEHIRMVIKTAGEPVGTLALALVGAEAQAKE